MAADPPPSNSKALVDRARRTFPVRAVRKFAEDDGGDLAVLVAWSALTSIFPISLALVAIGSAALGWAGVSADAITRTMIKLFPSDSASQQAALTAIEGVRRQTGVFAALALVGFLWTASGLFGAMERAFAVVFETGRRPFVRQKLMSLGIMAVFVVLTLLAVGTSALLALAGQVPGLSIAVGFWFQAAVGVVSGFLLFFLIYLVVPNRHLGLRIWTGALLAGVAFELLTLIFPIYLSISQRSNQHSRSLAFLFVLMAFFYFLGMITVLGAEVISVLDRRPAEADQSSAAQDPPSSWLRRAAFGGLAFAIGVIAARRRD